MRYVVTSVPKAPSGGPRARTYLALLEAAMELIRTGIMPSVAQVAARADVSRATAYRYFPSRSKLIAAVVDASLGPVRTTASRHEGGRERVMELFDHTFPRFKEYETEMRAALQLALEHRALERAGMLEEEPYRRGHRVRILAQALSPFEGQIPKPLIRRLHRALSTIYGYEAYLVLKDIWNAPDREVEATVRWMAKALIDATINEATERQGVSAASSRENDADS
jgi:AcrR family transcriptional regulator